MLIFTRAKDFVSDSCMSAFSNQPQKFPHSNSETIDEDEESNEIEINELRDLIVGEKELYVRDGVGTHSRLIKILLGPSRTQLPRTMQCAEGETFQTTKEFAKIDSDEEEAAIPSTTDDHIK